MGGASGKVVAGSGRGHGALLEREGELAALGGAVEAAIAGDGAALLITGVAGVGRSRLLHEAGTLARAAGCDVRSARGLPFARRDPGGLASTLLGCPTADAVSDALDALTTGGPVVLLADDLQLADPASRAVLAAAAGALHGRPVTLVAATRAADARAWRGVRALPIGPLTRRGVAAAVRGALGPTADAAFCRACAVQTAGNPRALRELLTAASTAGLSPTARNVPALTALARRTAAHAVTAAFAACSPEAVRLACALAALADDDLLPDPGLLAELTPDATETAAAELIDAGVLRRATPAAFATPATASAIVSAAPPLTWGEIQLVAARARAAAAPGDPQTAEHLLHAPCRGDGWVVGELRRAATAAVERGAPERAAALLDRALQEPPPAGEQAGVTFELSLAEAACGRPGAPERMRQALEAESDPAARARIVLALARLLAARGEYREATALVDDAASQLTGADDRLAHELRAAIVSVDRRTADAGADAARQVRRVLAQPPHEDGPADRVALVEAAHDGALRNRPCEVLIGLARRGWAEGRLLDEETPESPAIAALSAVLCWAGALEEDVAMLTQALATAQTRSSVLAAATARGGRAWPLYMLGRLDEAWADACAARGAERLGWAMFVATSRAVAAHVAIERGALDAAAEALTLPAEARWPSTRLRGPYFAPYFEARARLRLAEGDLDAALADARAAGDVLHRATGQAGSAFVPWRCTAALAHARAGRLDEGLAAAGEDITLAEASGNSRLRGIGLRTRGLLLPGAEGLPDLERSVAVLAQSEAALELARSRLELGAALRRIGRRAAAREPLRLALEAAERFGATSIADRATDELAAAGAPGVPTEDGAERAPSGVDALTPSERRVAALAADGLTNRAIAEALSVTTQTVNWHLGNAYRKLGVRRAGLADALRGA